ncbi:MULTISPECIES: hypothetical protein [unclassified Janthinobacterium]|uniref:hypothetical protein n=1 Tax=unclassified Janthinobacterium TaxID=2610881 RepID=UPI0025B033D0|nr:MULTISPECIES: hypothetical protein [unclassified Janthinobacterium]MDN2713486.1 hypothetical protein [Janthinobacterium sp. SUN120]MDO8065642.1 hypothetical protein [Janthinobacterium sp. SUN206]
MKRDYIGYVIALLSILIAAYISWYFYDKSIQFKQPTFSADFVPQTIYDVKEEVRIPLKVTREDGTPLNKSVRLASHTFWNAGNLPISAQDVLTPIRVTIKDDSANILSVSTERESRKVVGCSVKLDGKNSFIINFRILEQDDGCLVRMFYTGSSSVKYAISGDIVGVKKIALQDETAWDVIERGNSKTEIFERFASKASAIISVLVIGVFAMIFVHDNHGNSRRMWKANLGFVVALLLIVGADKLSSRIKEINSPVTVNKANWVSIDAP